MVKQRQLSHIPHVILHCVGLSSREGLLQMLHYERMEAMDQTGV